MHKSLLLKEIFNSLLQAFGQFQTNTREPVSQDGGLSWHFCGHSKLFVFVNFQFLFVILRPTSEIAKEDFFILLFFLLLLFSCFVICFTDYLS